MDIVGDGLRRRLGRRFEELADVDVKAQVTSLAATNADVFFIGATLLGAAQTGCDARLPVSCAIARPCSPRSRTAWT